MARFGFPLAAIWTRRNCSVSLRLRTKSSGLAQIYRKKGMKALVAELNKF